MILGIQAQSQRSIFSPAVLFSNGEAGVWYDPSDLDTMFQDSLGTTPVTSEGQSVGLLLDKRFGLVRGAEINSDPTVGWLPGNSSIITVLGDDIRVAYNGTTSPYAYKIVPTVSGQWYEFSASIVGSSTPGVTSSIRLGIGAGSFQNYQEPLTAGTRSRTVIFQATSNSTYITVIHTGNTQGGYVDFSGVSIKNLPGNHATQNTAAYRPILRQDRNVRYLEVDGSDDSMIIQGYRSTSNWSSSVAARKTLSGGRFIFEGYIDCANNYLGSTDNTVAVNSAPSGQANAKSIVALQDFFYSVSVTGDGVSSGDVSLFCRQVPAGTRSFYFGGRLYSLVLVNRAISPFHLALLDEWTSRKLPI